MFNRCEEPAWSGWYNSLHIHMRARAEETNPSRCRQRAQLPSCWMEMSVQEPDGGGECSNVLNLLLMKTSSTL